MLVSIIGAQGTGKTTLVSDIHDYLSVEKNTYVIINEIARLCPFPIGKMSGKQSQDWIINTQKYFENNCYNMRCPVITDRNMIDNYAHYIYWVGKDEAIENELISRYRRNDRIYLMPVNSAYLVHDGVRPTDPKFQLEINSIILHILDKLKIYNLCEVIEFSENSINEIANAIKNFSFSEHIQKNVLHTEYCYNVDIFEKIVLVNNLLASNIFPEYFDDLFYKNIILPKIL